MQAHEQGIGSGVLRARDIAAGKRINAYQVKAFFDRHRHNYVKARADGKTWENSKAWQAWDLWGGEPLRRQVESAVKKDKKRAEADKRKKKRALKKRSRRGNPGDSDIMDVAPSDRGEVDVRKSRNYTIYLMREKPDGLVLYKFESENLICPSASASEYAWRMNESALENTTTHIFTDEKDMRRFIKMSGKRVSAGESDPERNPRNSKVKDALAAEATRFKSFSKFSSAYWDACSRGIYWYATNEKKFEIGDAEKSAIRSGRMTLHCSPELALSGRNKGKKYVAELDLTRISEGFLVPRQGSGGSGVALTGRPEAVKINRVLEAKKAKNAFKWQLSILPSSKEELRLIWERAWEKRKKQAEKNKLRKAREAQRQAKRSEARAKEEEKAALREEKQKRKEAEAKKKKRIEAGKRAKSTKAAEKRAKAISSTTRKSRSTSSKAKKKGRARAKKNPMEGLEKWFSEKWVDLRASIYLSGDKKGQLKPGGWKHCGRPSGSSRAYPKCRPLKEAERMTPEQRIYAVRKKSKAERSASPTEPGQPRPPVMVSTYKKKTRS